MNKLGNIVNYSVNRSSKENPTRVNFGSRSHWLTTDIS